MRTSLPKILQDVRKRNSKARTFAPPDIDDDEMRRLAESIKAESKVFNDPKVNPIDLNSIEKIIAKIGSPKNLKSAKS